MSYLNKLDPSGAGDDNGNEGDFDSITLYDKNNNPVNIGTIDLALSNVDFSAYSSSYTTQYDSAASKGAVTADVNLYFDTISEAQYNSLKGGKIVFVKGSISNSIKIYDDGTSTYTTE